MGAVREGGLRAVPAMGFQPVGKPRRASGSGRAPVSSTEVRTSFQEQRMAATLTEETVAAPVRMDVEDGIAIVRLNQPGKPVNVISADLVTAMHDILTRLEEGGEGVR